VGTGRPVRRFGGVGRVGSHQQDGTGPTGRGAPASARKCPAHRWRFRSKLTVNDVNIGRSLGWHSSIWID
jgi:hypothetical protein